MISLLLMCNAWRQEAIMDAMYEAYKWDISRMGAGFRGRQWDSYNPMLPKKGLWEMGRDGWHHRKGILWACVILAFPALLLEVWLLHDIINPLYYLGWPVLAVIARGIVFNASLNSARKKYRPDTETQIN